MSTQDRMPAWLAEALRGRGTGGHRATTADRAQALAAYEARRRGAPPGPAAHGRILASLRSADDLSPLARRVFGLPR